MAMNLDQLKEGGLVALGGVAGLWLAEEVDKYVYPTVKASGVNQYVAGGAIVAIGSLLLLMFFKNKGFDEILLGMIAGSAGIAVSTYLPLA
ncbi:MAG: hypothetical protein QXI16_00050 [Sulfolobaceae archaeon]